MRRWRAQRALLTAGILVPAAEGRNPVFPGRALRSAAAGLLGHMA
jgi:hypothetical protein